MRLAALVSHPVQYFAPLFRKVATDPAVDLTVYYCSANGARRYFDVDFGKSIAWDIPLLDGYECRFLPAFPVPANSLLWPCNPHVVRELKRQRYDALWVHGYTGLTNWMGIITAIANDTPILLRGESNLLAERRLHRRLAKSVVLRKLFSQVAGCLYIGIHNKEYYRHYGASENRLFSVPYVVDNEFFADCAEQLSPKRASIRANWNIVDDRPVVLFAGKLVSWKQPGMLLEAYRRVRRRYQCALLYAGDGPLRDTLERQACEYNIPDVRFAGFLNQRELPMAYAAADILVLPSAYEPWGLVVNEAMNFGMAIVASDRVGAAGDLLHPGVNGYIFSHTSVDQLEAALEGLLPDSTRYRTFGQASSRIIRSWGLGEAASGVVRAAHSVCT
jgi:glycosyltransferase involved in cell wall biosynthesis